jgi:hypothetical protein
VVLLAAACSTGDPARPATDRALPESAPPVAAVAPSPRAADSGTADATAEASTADAAGDERAPDAAPDAPLDTTPPLFAGATAASTLSATRVMIAWPRATDDMSPPGAIRYVVYAATSSHAENFIIPSYTSAPGALALVADALAPSTRYFFVVRAEDAQGNIDANTIELTATTDATLTFRGDVMPIFLAHCAGNCHAQPDPDEQLDLSDAATAYSALVGKPSGQCPSTMFVAPAAPAQSYLVQKIEGAASDCFSGEQMPRREPALSPNEHDAIVGWIACGAQND